MMDTAGARKRPGKYFSYSNSIKTWKCLYWPDAFASGTSHTMRGDLQCNTIFFQPKGWKTAVRLHRSHKTNEKRFMEDQYYNVFTNGKSLL